MRFFRIPKPLFNAEGGGGGGAAAAAAAAAAQDKGGAGDQGGGGGSWTPPQGMDVPDNFKGNSAEETLGKVLNGYSELNTRAEGLRTQLASRPGAPAKAEDYTFTPGEKIKGYFGDDPGKHAGLTAARTVFHKHGVPQAAFEGIINDLYGGMAEAGTLAPPYDPNVEVKSYAEAGGFDAKTVAQHFGENETFAKGLVQQLGDAVPAKLSTAAQAELMALTDTAGGNALIRAISARLAQNGFRVAGDSNNQNGPVSDAELEQLRKDPRIDPRNTNHKDETKRYDPALRQRYTDAMERKGLERQKANQ